MPLLVQVDLRRAGEGSSQVYTEHSGGRLASCIPILVIGSGLPPGVMVSHRWPLPWRPVS